MGRLAVVDPKTATERARRLFGPGKMAWGCFKIVMIAAGLMASLAGLVFGETAQVGAMAPAISGGPWINSDPLTLTALRGRVVLVEFWTYG